MAETEPKIDGEEDEELIDYEEETEVKETKSSAKGEAMKKGSYSGIDSMGFPDFLLKPELLNAITASGFEHPSEVQQECIPQAIQGDDIICQAKSGMGKTAVFVLATLQQIDPEPGVVDTLVITHARELAFQITQEFMRFSKFFEKNPITVKVFIGGIELKKHLDLLRTSGQPNIVVGTPGRLLALVKEKALKLDKLKRFILDECDQLLGPEQLDMRRDIQKIFKMTPHEKQVMMFTATLSKEIRPVCRKFTQDNAHEIYVENESKLTLDGLQQYYVKLEEKQKIRKLLDLLDQLEFNQVVIFVSQIKRCKELSKLLREQCFPSIAVHSGLKQPERLKLYNSFKDGQERILVATDLFGRGIDFERVNIVFNYDMPRSHSNNAEGTANNRSAADQYLHRVGRSGRFGTKGLGVSFITTAEDEATLKEVQSRFEVAIPELPDSIDPSTYTA